MKTIKDVAELAKVSTATVSNVLSGKRYVSPELVKRVKNAILHLNYKPSAIAKSLKTNKTNTIGVIVSDIQNPYYAGVVAAINTYCFKKGYGVILGESYENPKRQEYAINLMLEKRVDGFIIAPVGKNREELDLLIKSQIPFLLINRTFPGYDGCSVTVDNEGGAYKITKYLIELGHNRIAIVCGPKEYSTTQERLAGYLRAYRESKISTDNELIGFSKLEIQPVYKKAMTILKKSPTAIFATNNIITIGCLLALKKTKKMVPEDVSFVSFEFEENPLPSIVKPSLTCVVQPGNRVGMEAAKILLARLFKKVCKDRVVLKTKIILGESTAPAPK